METAKRIYAPHELMPAIPIHPGEIIKDELQARGISQKKFAALIGVSHTVLNEVLNGKRPVTTEYALKIEAATGITANLWINLQADYNMQTARRDTGLSAVLDQIRKAVAVLKPSTTNPIQISGARMAVCVVYPSDCSSANAARLSGVYCSIRLNTTGAKHPKSTSNCSI